MVCGTSGRSESFTPWQRSFLLNGSTHAAFQALLSAAHADDAWSALRDLGCVKDDEQFVHRQKLRLPFFRSIMTSLSGVFLLDGAQRGRKCICTCRCFALMGECSHINFVLWLNADPSIPPLAPLSSLTLKGARRLSEADEEFRRGAAKGRPLKVPKASAWLTLQHLRLRYEKRSEIRRGRYFGKACPLHWMMHSMDRQDAVETCDMCFIKSVNRNRRASVFVLCL